MYLQYHFLLLTQEENQNSSHVEENQHASQHTDHVEENQNASHVEKNKLKKK